LFPLGIWWTHKGSNLGPLPCEGNALPLSYASGISVHDPTPEIGAGSAIASFVAAIYEVRAIGVKRSRTKQASSGCASGPREGAGIGRLRAIRVQSLSWLAR
jgi:hypothetical protein